MLEWFYSLSASLILNTTRIQDKNKSGKVWACKDFCIRTPVQK